MESLGFISKIKSFINSKNFMILSIVLFALITFPKMIVHYPWYDEVHAWYIAERMDLGNFVSIMRQEGHPLLWYLIIMPFAKTNFAYPYSLLIINWIFCFAAIVFMWKKAPFGNLFKFVITFSSVFISYYSFYSRCYSLGILGLFIIASMFKDQLKRPYLYSFMIGITAHTNLLAAISASAFGIIFLYKILNSNRKHFYISLAIIAFFIILFVLPFLNNAYENILFEPPGLYNLINFFNKGFESIFILLFYVSSLISLIFFTKSKNALFFIVYTNLMIFILCALFYPLFAHHFIFLFINLILALWITQIDFPLIPKYYKFVCFLLACLLFIPINHKLNYHVKHDSRDFAQRINEMPIFKKEKLFFEFELETFSLIPFLDKDVNYDVCRNPQIPEIKYLLTKQELDLPVIESYDTGKDFIYIYKITNSNILTNSVSNHGKEVSQYPIGCFPKMDFW